MKARKSLISLIAIAVVMTVVVAYLTKPQSRERVIEDALANGAIVISCEHNVCKNARTQEIVGQGEVGTYLVYPDDPEHQIMQRNTQEQLAKL